MSHIDRKSYFNAEQPYFSIIITCYNYEKYVGKAIESALSQSYKSFEVIVVDDGSTDSSWRVIQNYKSQVRAYSIENCGSIDACLFGMSKSIGAYILFLDADDLLRSEALAVAHRSIKERDVAKIQFKMQPIDSNGNRLGDAFPNVGSNFDSKACIESIIVRGYYDTPPTSGNIYRRDVYEDLGSITYDFGIDGVAYLLAPFIGEVLHLSWVLGDYRIHGHNRSLDKSGSKRFFRNNVRVFRQRLSHLNQLLNEKNIGEIKTRKYHLYTAKNLVMSFLAENKRPPIRLSRIYLTLSNERPSRVRRLISLIFIISIYVLPIYIANLIVSARQNQSKVSGIRRFIKRLVTPKTDFKLDLPNN